MRDQRTLSERFWSKVDKAGSIPDHCSELGPCWLWVGGRFQTVGKRLPYGMIVVDGKIRAAHRISWEHVV